MALEDISSEIYSTLAFQEWIDFLRLFNSFLFLIPWTNSIYVTTDMKKLSDLSIALYAFSFPFMYQIRTSVSIITLRSAFSQVSYIFLNILNIFMFFPDTKQFVFFNLLSFFVVGHKFRTGFTSVCDNYFFPSAYCVQ